jgi:hypothetical protein
VPPRCSWLPGRVFGKLPLRPLTQHYDKLHTLSTACSQGEKNVSSTVKKAYNDPQDRSFLRAGSSQALTMQTKAKTSLFRFVTARAPQLIDEDRFALGFVEHPDPAGSHFSDGIVGYADLEAARLAVRDAVDTFPAGSKFGSVTEVKNLVPVLWDFSNRLLKNRNQIDDEVLDQPSESDLSTATVTTNLPKL